MRLKSEGKGVLFVDVAYIWMLEKAAHKECVYVVQCASLGQSKATSGPSIRLCCHIYCEHRGVHITLYRLYVLLHSILSDQLFKAGFLLHRCIN